MAVAGALPEGIGFCIGIQITAERLHYIAVHFQRGILIALFIEPVRLRKDVVAVSRLCPKVDNVDLISVLLQHPPDKCGMFPTHKISLDIRYYERLTRMYGRGNRRQYETTGLFCACDTKADAHAVVC